MHYKLFYSLFIAMFLSVGMTSVQAATISFNNSLLDVNQGDLFSLTVQGSGFPDISGGGLNFNFDPSFLQINSVTINTTVFEFEATAAGMPNTGALDNSMGTLINTHFDTFIGAMGSFDVMTIGFEAIGHGQSSLLISGSSWFPFADEFGSVVGGVIYESATINVSAVPLPAAAWLFGVGLLALVGFGRKK